MQRTEPTMRLDAPQRPVTRTSQPPRSSTPSRPEPGQQMQGEAAGKPAPAPLPPQEPAGPGKDRADTAQSADREEVVFSLALRLPSEGIPADRLLHELQRLGLSLDDRHIYSQAGEDDEFVFSVANLFEPGVLDPLPSDSRLLGLSFFFMAEPSPETGSRLDRMLGTAYECARLLGGQLEDMNHRPLTAARELELKMAAVGARSD